jgi:hypothetical protein
MPQEVMQNFLKGHISHTRDSTDSEIMFTNNGQVA